MYMYICAYILLYIYFLCIMNIVQSVERGCCNCHITNIIELGSFV